MTRSLNFFALALTTALLSPAMAGTITIGNTAVAAPDHFADFEGPAIANQITNQFAASGLTFTPISGTGIALINNDSCNNAGQGVTGNYLYMGVSAPCYYSYATDAVSIKFNSNVSELSWTGFSYGDSYTISALLDGTVVSSLILNSSNQFVDQTVLFTGSVFNELRFVESDSNNLFAIDNMSWKSAAAVPLPGSVALLGIGMLGMAAARRRRK